jgi:hypothetical protein
MVTTWREVGVNYGGQHIGKGIARALLEVDKALGKAGAPLMQRPSVWVTVVGTFAFPAAAMFLKLKDPWDKLAILTGGFLSTGLWDIVEEAMVAAGGAAGAAYVPADTFLQPSFSVSSSRPAQTAAQEKVY